MPFAPTVRAKRGDPAGGTFILGWDKMENEKTLERTAVITDTHLGLHNGCIMNYKIYTNYQGAMAGQDISFGDRVLDKPTGEIPDIIRIGTAYGMTSIREILVTLDVEKWEQLKGQKIRIRLDSIQHHSKIVAIGHWMKDRWFDPERINLDGTISGTG